jgi:hypothetical protein
VEEEIMNASTLELILKVCELADKLPEELRKQFYKDKITPILDIIITDTLADMNRGRR